MTISIMYLLFWCAVLLLGSNMASSARKKCCFFATLNVQIRITIING